MVRAHAGREVVAHACPIAQAAGVRPGLDVATARALLSPRPITTSPHTPAQDQADLRALARWALGRVAPLVGIDGEDGLLIDLTGTQRLYRGEARVARSLLRAMARRGLRARCAIAATPACARALARHGLGACVVVPAGQERAAIEPLPILAALEPLPEGGPGPGVLLEALGALGVSRVGELLDLPRPALAMRWGQGLVRRLDAMLGRCDEPLDLVLPAPAWREELLPDGPMRRLEDVLCAVRTLLERLLVRLARQQRGARELCVRLDRADLPPARLELILACPTHHAPHVWNMLRPRLERTHLGHGVEAIELHAPRTALCAPSQPWLLERGADVGQALGHAVRPRAACPPPGELIDVLTQRLGPARVLVVRPHASHVPERAWRMLPALDMASDLARGPRAVIERPPDGARPTLLLPAPAPARVMLLQPEGPIARVDWLGPSGAVLACAGPQRIAGEWWRTDRTVGERAYYRVGLDQGTWLWIFHASRSVHGAGDALDASSDAARAGEGWFVHGVWA